MWSYHGAKTNVVKYYPKPKFGKIIEPFAGTARYSLKYFDRDVLLIDKYDVIVKIWKWLQQCSPNDILKLPRKLHRGMNLNDYTFDCEEAKMLMGFLVSKGVEAPRLSPTRWLLVDRPNFTNFLLKKIAANLFKIKHWEIRLGTYTDINNEEATWFIDPPYQLGGHSYKHNNKKIDFQQLADWARARSGQIIVCESVEAKWLNFQPLTTQRVRSGMQREGIWTNDTTLFKPQGILDFE